MTQTAAPTMAGAPRRRTVPRRPRFGVRTTRLTGRGKTLGALGIFCVLVSYGAGRIELLYLGLLLVLLPAFAGLLVRFRRVGIESSRTFSPSVVAAGQPTVVDLTVTNRSNVPTPRLAWRDYRPWITGSSLPGTLPALAARRGRSQLAGSSARLRYELTPPDRGIFEIGPMTVVLADPFGLAVGEVTVSGTDTLVVTPRIASLSDNGLAIQSSDGSATLVRRAVGGEDDLSTREYRTGDALRRVHWRATARHGELMVRQEEPRSHAEARIILDTRRHGFADAMFARVGIASESFELALSIAGSLAMHLDRGGFQAEIVETGRRQLQPVSETEAFLRTLAVIELDEDAGRLPADSPLSAAPRPDRAHGSVFAVFADIDDETADRLVAQRQSYDLAVAFDLSGHPSPQVDRLRDVGWTVVPVQSGTTVESAWHAVAELRGARFGR